MMKRVSWAALALAAALTAAPAHAAVLFSQNFNAGLGANETVGGAFTAANGQVGHALGYNRGSYSYYQLALDLRDATSAALSLDFTGRTEFRYDGFNLVASTSDVFSPAGLVTPTLAGFYTPVYGEAVDRIGAMAFSGSHQGPLTFDLSAFSGQLVNLRFQFASDYAAGGAGIQLDNLKVTGTLASAVPEPATWAMMITGFGLAGAALRRRRAGLGATLAAN